MKQILLSLFILSTFSAFSQIGDPKPENRILTFDSTDLKIIQRADEVLSDASKWHKHDDRACDDDIETGIFSLFCALNKASIEIAGVYEHRRPVMQQVRFTLEKYEKGRVTNHRLMDWNNHPDTSFDEVKLVLKEAIEEIEKSMN